MKPDFEQAVKLYTQLADESGDPAAQHMLGLAHFEGLGVEIDFAKVCDGCLHTC
jgi:TPR repeat protein